MKNETTGGTAPPTSTTRPASSLPKMGGTDASAGEMAIDLLREYAREKPEVVALCALGVGFILGWRLRSW